ncbi:uncharacterized protein LOC135193594 [Vanessa tameamea]|uniref:Uncharacterized protein LOC135193594 n=1 Tax=Vanessa tameamea TaxID=334116 RepID=A0ABM4AN93_VANTA
MTQYNNPDFSEMQQFQYNPYTNVPNIYQQYPNQAFVDNKWNLQENFNYEDYNDYVEDNTCVCDDCDNLKPSCRNMCPNCASIPPFPGPGYVFLSFPYPYPVTSKPRSKKSTKTTLTSTVITTSEVTTQKTTKGTELQFEEQNDVALIDKLDNSKVPDIISKPLEVKDKSQYMMTALRRTKPNWVPKYGILPISDQFAEKLMLQLRSMKLLHPRKDYLRNVDNIKLVN